MTQLIFFYSHFHSIRCQPDPNKIIIQTTGASTTNATTPYLVSRLVPQLSQFPKQLTGYKQATNIILDFSVFQTTKQATLSLSYSNDDFLSLEIRGIYLCLFGNLSKTFINSSLNVSLVLLYSSKRGIFRSSFL